MISLGAIIISLYSLTFNISSVIDDCINKYNFEEAHRWLARMKKDDYLSEEETCLFHNKDRGDYVHSEYLIKKFDLLDAETSYLLNLGDEESLSRIISVMYNFNLDYSPHLGEFQSWNTNDHVYKENKRCEDEIIRFNRKCDILLNKAINIRNLDFAKSIISLYKDNLVIERTDYSLFGNNTYSISLSKTDVENAKEKLDEAIKSGVFGDKVLLTQKIKQSKGNDKGADKVIMRTTPVPEIKKEEKFSAPKEKPLNPSYKTEKQPEIEIKEQENSVQSEDKVSCESVSDNVGTEDNTQVETISSDETIYQVVEQQPEFPGGMSALMKYLRDNINYPRISRDNNSQGKTYVNFVVNTDGSIQDVEVMRSSGDELLDKEAARLVKTMPKWNPGRAAGKAVRVRFTLPIVFRF